jgi:hypothetical protein
MKNNFEERKNNRIAFAKQQAEKKANEAKRLHKEADNMASIIPPGQPILIGHHSENAHRNYLNKIHNKMRKAFETEDKGQYYADKAESIENNTAIFSDDPQALEKLRKKLKEMQASHEFMKKANKCIRNNDKEAFLLIPFATEEIWKTITTPDFLGGIGYQRYALQNSSANMRQVKQRIQHLEKLATMATKETIINGVRIVENVEANRLQLFFGEKPPKEIREKLSRQGFRFSRKEGNAWQRHLTNSAIYTAELFLQQLQ